ncbi:MAG: retention module-containing protein, partial [Betaproteobacteria bacterium]|nr:retention module-containing protein [Betaproteobacteria bacterium]
MATTTVRAEGIVANMKGTAYLRYADGSLHVIKIGDRIAEGQVIVTAADGFVELRGMHDERIEIGQGREVLADANLLNQEVQTPQDAAVSHPTSDLDNALTALNSGADPFATLDPTGAGLGAGGANEGHGFVRLLRISEGLDPLALPQSQYPQNDRIELVAYNRVTEEPVAGAPVAEEPNRPPHAADDTARTPAGKPVIIDVLANDSDPDGDPLHITHVDGQPIAPGETVNVDNGTVTLNDDGTVTFTPDPDYHGDAHFDYTVDDGNGGSDTGNVTVTVGQPPVATDDTARTPFEKPVTINVLANDSDPDGDPLHITQINGQ